MSCRWLCVPVLTIVWPFTARGVNSGRLRVALFSCEALPRSSLHLTLMSKTVVQSGCMCSVLRPYQPSPLYVNLRAVSDDFGTVEAALKLAGRLVEMRQGCDDFSGGRLWRRVGIEPKRASTTKRSGQFGADIIR